MVGQGSRSTQQIATRRRASALALVAAVAAVVATAASPAEAARSRTRVERAVRSAAPDAKLVKESYVSIYSPLPAADGPHPKACDWIGYERYRSARGPRRASRADAVFTIIPGFLGGAG